MTSHSMEMSSMHDMFRKYKTFPAFCRVIETREEVCEKREIAWEHKHEMRVFPRNFKFLANFRKRLFYSIGTQKKMFSIFFIIKINSVLKTKKHKCNECIKFIQIQFELIPSCKKELQNSAPF